MKEKLLADVTVPGGERIKDPTGFSDIPFGSIVGWTISTLFVIGAIATLIYLIIGGFRWIASGGDAEKIAEARNTIIYALIGLGTILIAVFVVKFLADIMGVPFLEFSSSSGGAGGSDDF